MNFNSYFTIKHTSNLRILLLTLFFIVPLGTIYGQNQLITIAGKNITLLKAFDAIESHTSNPALHAGECVFLVAGCHIRNRDFQFPLHGMTGISLVGFQDVQHITGCPEFLFNGVYKSGQLGFDFFPALLNDLVRL